MKERVITAVVLLAVVIGALFLDPTGWAVKILLCLIAIAGGVELGNILKLPFFWGITAGIISGVFIHGQALPIPFHVFAMLAAAPTLIWSTIKNSKPLMALSGTIWLYATIVPLGLLCQTKSPSFWPLLMTAAIPIWCGDTAAIFVGRAFGKHKLAPEISPKKTWEGAAGNFAACVLAAVILGAIFHYPMLPMALLGLNCGILGQAGDLFESWLKRKADMKDSGNILPGHGGVLDRIDSLMATAPISLLILQLVVPAVAK